MKKQEDALSAAEKIRAECEEPWIYTLGSADSGSVILCEKCPCLVTDEKFEAAKRAEAELESGPPNSGPGVYLVRSSDDVLHCHRFGRVH